MPFEGTESVRVANVSWDQIPNGQGLEHERSLAKGLGVCSGNSKEPFAARPKRTGGLVGAWVAHGMCAMLHHNTACIRT